MLATAGSLPPAGQDARWAYETKQDGQRAVIYLSGDDGIVLRARSGRTSQPPTRNSVRWAKCSAGPPRFWTAKSWSWTSRTG